MSSELLIDSLNDSHKPSYGWVFCHTSFMQLYNICYFTIDSDLKLFADLQAAPRSIPASNPLAWIGIAKFKVEIDQTNIKQLNTDQIAVRQLLTNMLVILRLDNTLIEDSFPYRLSHTNHYVCFSHSKHQISCMISRQPSAIDSEVSIVPLRIANRFYHPNDIKWLSTLPKCYDTHPVSLAAANNLLWMLKECCIKINSPNHRGLMQGLKHNFSQVADKLLQSQIQDVLYPKSDAHKQTDLQHTESQHTNDKNLMNYQLCMTTLPTKTNHNNDNEYAVIYIDSHQTLLILEAVQN